MAIQKSGVAFSMTPPLRKKLSELRKTTTYKRAAAQALEPIGKEFSKKIKGTLSEDFSKGKESGRYPRRRSRQLHKSIGYRTLKGNRENLGTLRIGVLSRRKKLLMVANVQEFGKVIKRKPGGPRLTVPLDAALNARGLKKFSARDAEKKFAGGTFASKGVIFGRRKSKQRKDDPRKIVPLFALRESVKIPARPFIRPRIPEIREASTGILREIARKILAK